MIKTKLSIEGGFQAKRDNYLKHIVKVKTPYTDIFALSCANDALAISVKAGYLPNNISMSVRNKIIPIFKNFVKYKGYKGLPMVGDALAEAKLLIDQK